LILIVSALRGRGIFTKHQKKASSTVTLLPSTLLTDSLSSVTAKKEKLPHWHAPEEKNGFITGQWMSILAANAVEALTDCCAKACASATR
jgi:hypothetical protein